jgi:hypothetical protein
MIPVVTLIALIEAVTALANVGYKTVVAIEKLKNGDPDEVDVSELKQALAALPDLTKLYPPEDAENSEAPDSK